MVLIARDCALNDIDEIKDTPDRRYTRFEVGEVWRNIFLRVKEDVRKNDECRKGIQNGSNPHSKTRLCTVYIDSPRIVESATTVNLISCKTCGIPRHPPDHTTGQHEQVIGWRMAL